MLCRNLTRSFAVICTSMQHIAAYQSWTIVQILHSKIRKADFASKICWKVLPLPYLSDMFGSFPMWGKARPGPVFTAILVVMIILCMSTNVYFTYVSFNNNMYQFCGFAPADKHLFYRNFK